MVEPMLRGTPVVVQDYPAILEAVVWVHIR